MPPAILGGVFPVRETPSLRTFKDPPPALLLVPPQPAAELLLTDYATDAHFVAYYVQEAPGQPPSDFPRVAKSLLPELRAQGAEVFSSYWIAEIDTPGHQPHIDPAAAREMLRALTAALTPPPSWAYTTRAGWRFLWELSPALPADELEARRPAFIRARVIDIPASQRSRLDLASFEADGKDWTHLWRAPKATRDGVPQGVQSWFELLETGAPPLDPRGYPAGPRTPPPSASADLPPAPHGPCPTHEEAADLLDHLYSASGQRLASEIRRRLLGRQPLHGAVFESIPPAPPHGPGRSTAIHRLAGQAAAFLQPLMPQVTPELAYALLWPAVCQFDPDVDPRGPQDWCRHLWDALLRYWSPPAVPGAPIATPQPPPLGPIAARQRTLLGGILEGMRRWAGPDWPEDYDSQCLYAQRRLLLVSRQQRAYHVLRPDGYYDPYPVGDAALVPRLRQLGMDELVPTSTAEGKSLALDHILRQHGQPFRRTVVRVGITGPTGQPGGILALDPTAEDPEPSFQASYFARRADLAPRFDADVDQWLRLFAGARYPELAAWIGYALAIEEGPICALALHGASNAGKSMLVQGLAECMTPEGFYSGSSAFTRFNDELLESPFLFVEEGFLDSIPVPDRANLFRGLVDGSSQNVEKKYQSRLRVENPLRMVITANNTGFIDDLTGRRELTAEDRQAIAQRLLLIPITAAGREHLSRLGGRRHTGGWVRTSAQLPSQYRLARHFLHLYQERHTYIPCERLLVEGHLDDRGALRQMQTRSDAAEAVLEALLEMIEALPHRPQPGLVYRRPGADGQGGRAGLFVSIAAVQSALRAMARRAGGRTPGPRQIHAVLPRFARAMGCRISFRDGTRYAELDTAELLRLADESGFPAEVLGAIAAGTFAAPAAPALRALSSLLTPSSEPPKVN